MWTLFIKATTLNLFLLLKYDLTNLFLGFSGPDRLPAGGEERPGELEERPREEDQNAGVRTEAREVSALPPTTCSVTHNIHTSASDSL